MPDWQTIVVVLIVLVAASWIVRKILRAFSASPPQSGCGTSCHGCSHASSASKTTTPPESGFVAWDELVKSSDRRV